MPIVELASSPVAPSRAPARIHVREAGAGPAVVILHGGWGYEAYSFDAAIAALAPRHRVLAPDRVGYGRSGPAVELPRGFHAGMAEETFAVMDALGVREAALWGHSDGSVVAAWMAFLRPERVSALVLEALHFFAWKPASIPFFETAVEAPERFGPAVVEACRRDHGEGWREVLASGGRAWLAIIEEGRRGLADVHAGRLGEVRAPALLLHGRRDPRTEPGELEAAARALPHARVELLDAGHAPHAGRTAASQAVGLAATFLAGEGWPHGARSG
jgi:pimeloyl-ACP methyl ester carboxylesterase